MKKMKADIKNNPHDKSWFALLKKDLKTNRSLYILFIPALLYYLIFHYGSIYGAIIAFMDYSPRLGVTGSPWVGLKHFLNFFKNPMCSKIISNTLKISIVSMVFNFTLPIILALLLNELKSVRFSRFIQNATYMPHFISLVVICGMVRVFTKDTGIITYFMSLFGAERVSLLIYPEYFLPVYVATSVWQSMGWNAIIYLAALTAVDEEQYEAATIDGANRFQKLVHITLPGISTVIVTMFVLRIGSLMSVGHEQILLLSTDATMSTANVISTYVYQKGLLEQNWSFSTAVNMFNSIINIIMLTAANWISRRFANSSLW